MEICGGKKAKVASEAVEWFYMKGDFSDGVFIVVFAVNGVEADHIPQ